MYTIGTIIFVIFGRTTVQSWNTYWLNDKSPEDTDEKMPLLNQETKHPNLDLEEIESFGSPNNLTKNKHTD